MPLITTANSTDSLRRYEALPPWLVSMLVHMLAVIALGMFHVGLAPDTHLSLIFASEGSHSNPQTEIDSLTELDVAIEADFAGLATIVETPAIHPASELITSLEAGWDDLVTNGGDAASLLPGFGEGALTPGRGKGKGKTSLFGLAGEGGKFVYVFDRSASMYSSFSLYSEEGLLGTITPLRSAKMEMARSLGELSNSHQFQIVFYNHAPWLYGQSHYADKLFAATQENKRQANEFIEDMQAEGFTNHQMALEAAIALKPDVIFLLTDGEAKDDLHPNVVQRMSKYCRQRRITINIVHFSNSPRPGCTLIPLAEETGGRHIFISLESLAEIMAQPMAMKGF